MRGSAACHLQEANKGMKIEREQEKLRPVFSVGGANRCSFVNRINLFHAFAVMPSTTVSLPCLSLCGPKKLLRIQNIDKSQQGSRAETFLSRKIRSSKIR